MRKPPRDERARRQISRAISTSGCAPQIRVVSVNTEFCTTVEKRCYTSRAVSPVRDLCTRDAMAASTSMTRSSNNVILATRMSSVFIQQVHKNASSTEVVRATELLSSSPVISPEIQPDEKRDGKIVSKRTFSLRNVDCRLEDYSLSRFRDGSEEEKDEADARRMSPSGSKHAQRRHVQRPEAKERITIVPIVLTDGVAERPKTADVNFAIPRFVEKLAPELSYEIVPFGASRKSRRMRSLSDGNGGNETRSRHRTAKPTCSSDKLADEESSAVVGGIVPRPPVVVVDRVDESRARESNNVVTPTTSVAKSSRRSDARRARGKCEHRREREPTTEKSRRRIVKTIPGMRSSPEDFLCDTS